MVKLIKNIIKKVWTSIDDFWLFLNTENDNIKIEKSRQEIKDLIPVYCFAISIFIVLIVSGEYYKKMGEELSAFSFFIAVIIFLIWAFAILHTKNSHKRHSHQFQAKNFQVMHE